MTVFMTRTRKGTAASISSNTSSKARGMRRQRNKGKIRAGRYICYSSSLLSSFFHILSCFRSSFCFDCHGCSYEPSSSPGEEMALVEHLKGMDMTSGAKRELKYLLVSLLMLGKEDTARKLQRVAENFQLSQMAAVKLAEDAAASDIIDEKAYSFDRYIQIVRKEPQHGDTFSWQCKALVSP